MSTVSVINVKHASSASNNIVLDSSGNATFAGTAAMASSFLRNRIINGDMRIDQRNAGAAVTVNGNFQYPVDRFLVGGVPAGGTFTAQRSTVAPAGFVNSLLCTVTGVDSSLASGDYYFPLLHRIEGFNVADLAWGSSSAVSVVLSFWCRGSVTGTYAAAVRNSASNRSYIATFSINAANTWEYKTITIPGDQSGTWLTDSGIGIDLAIGAIGGSSVQGTAGVWSASNTYTTSACVNWMATNGATFYLTGVQLEVGSAATPFERRQYGQELALCQRYYEKSYNTSTAPGSNVTGSVAQGVFQPTNANTTGGDISGIVSFRVTKRAAPTGYYWDLAGNASRVSNDVANNNKTISAGNVISSVAENGYHFDFIVASASNNRAYWCWAMDAEL